VTSTGMVVPSSSFLRNRIINGDMRISQRNGTSAGTYGAGAAYWLDRWVNTATIANNMQVQQSTVAPAGFNNSTIFRALTGATIGSSDIFVSQHMIVWFNVSRNRWHMGGSQFYWCDRKRVADGYQRSDLLPDRRPA
jgi:hypothetical protein